MDFISSSELTEAEESKYVLDYLPLVKRIVKQLMLQANNILDAQDIEQIALMGLLEALRRYGHPDQQFAGYARHRIRGAILDQLREHDWRPRQLRQKTHKINDAIRQLSKKLGKPLTAEDITDQLALSAEEYQEYLQLENAKSMQSLDELLAIETAAHSLQSQNLEEQFIVQDSMKHALATLEKRELLILVLYYQHEMNLKEIAAICDLTEARVCQINKKTTEKIKNFFSIKRE